MSFITTLLTSYFSKFDHNQYGILIEQSGRNFQRYISEITDNSTNFTIVQTDLVTLFLKFIIESLETHFDAAQKLREEKELLINHYFQVSGKKAFVDIMTQSARTFGFSETQLKNDIRAFSRWFDFETIIERYDRRINHHDYVITFFLSRISAIFNICFQNHSLKKTCVSNWVEYGIEDRLLYFTRYEGDRRVSVQAMKCIGHIAALVDNDCIELQCKKINRKYLYTYATDRNADVYCQIEALRLCAQTESKTFFRFAEQRFYMLHSAPQDDFFVRAAIVDLMGEFQVHYCGIPSLLPVIAHDSSILVRQRLVHLVILLMMESDDAESCHSAQVCLKQLCCNDRSPKVRAAAILPLMKCVLHDKHRSYCLTLITHVLHYEKDTFVLRVVLTKISDTSAFLRQHKKIHALKEFYLNVLASLGHCLSGTIHRTVQHWIAQTSEILFLQHNEHTAHLLSFLGDKVGTIRPGGSLLIKHEFFKGLDIDLICRVLSVLAYQDFGFQVRQSSAGITLFRGDRFCFKVWRIVFEFLHPSPDKRQGCSHIIGRRYRTTIIIPSSILSELTKTHVPGEPLFINDDGGWRNFLPLPDMLLSSLKLFRRQKSVRLYSSEGVTTIEPPIGFLRKIRAFTSLTINFSEYARLRNWHEKELFEPETYIVRLRNLGFNFLFRSHTTDMKSDTINTYATRFFTICPLFSIQEFRDYFISIYHNSLKELIVFSLLIIIGFIIKKEWNGIRTRRARRKIAMIIGGWGTRGKSGTERLKAALFEGTGHGFVSKTTGCEAKFLHAHPFSKAFELDIFRPFDKATIWEHNKLLRYAASLHARLFLWECMGLSQEYVTILQKHWSRDDYSTITNTYPDHEDLQGPAGYNIPEVMTNFIPSKGTLITTEEEMNPILRHAAQEEASEFTTVTWLESGLLPDEILERFPYTEHPSNIALTAALARSLGIDERYALKEMADHIIPDIGVLKLYGPAPVKERFVEFANGFSANERFGMLTNWNKLGFSGNTPSTTPDVIVVTLVNNRADRVSRSQMFAKLIVEDIQADFHVIIGTNCKGMLGYIHQSVNGMLAELEKEMKKGNNRTELKKRFRQTADRFRLVTTEHHISGRLNAVVKSLSRNRYCIENVNDETVESKWYMNRESTRQRLEYLGCTDMIEEIIHYADSLIDEFNEYKSIAEGIESEQYHTFNNAVTACLDYIRSRFFLKLVCPEKNLTQADLLLKTIITRVPPGLCCRIMGVQNIKGPGLDFVYSFEAWEQCQKLCTRLINSEREKINDALVEIAQLQEMNLLCCEQISATFTTLEQNGILKDTNVAEKIAGISQRIAATLESVEVEGISAQNCGIGTKIIRIIEKNVDFIHSIIRTLRAEQIYRDLAGERISHKRAIVELRHLNRLQKGGWLVTFFQSCFKKFSNLG